MKIKIYSVFIILASLFMVSCYDKTTCCLVDGSCQDAGQDIPDADADIDTGNLGG
ncbi:hypothetical protein KKF34_08675 [Myxococcota bacterium]|nr:hypothetical protein [Myxococcota bacterium]MBU1379868.1 hypothetical protein [Myxococcota bacterium]MBU1496938.1 hypothetical protein [Myxococcota bacterium]